MKRLGRATAAMLLLTVACSSGPQAAPTASGSAAPVTLSSVPPSFVGAAPLATDGAGCNLEAVNEVRWTDDVVLSPGRASILVRGWAAGTKVKVAPTSIYLRLEDQAGSHFFAPTTIYPRPDVAEYFKAPALESTGFRVTFSAQDLPAGDYRAAVVMEVGGRALLCQQKRTLRL
jgi:hypothetical protein